MKSKLYEFLEKFKLPIGLSVVGLTLILGGIFVSSKDYLKQPSFPKESIVDKDKFIYVDVSGAVNKPGVYKLKPSSRIEEAIAAAEGFSDQANDEYISKYLNMAQKLTDGAKIYVPFTGEDSGSSRSSAVVAGVNVSSKVNINSSSQAELEDLPGIGPDRASKIISDRPYQTIEDLLTKKVISNGIFEKIKDQITAF